MEVRDSRTGVEHMRRHRWTSSWITTSEIANRTDLGAVAGLEASSRSSPPEVVHFVRRIEVPSDLERATLTIAADSRYIVWIDGVEIIRGPGRYQPRRLRADEMDVTSHFTGRRSVILAVSVTYYGDPNAIWMPARSLGGLGTGPALLAEITVFGADGRSNALASDTNWRAKVSNGRTRLRRRAVEGVPVEVIDARTEVDDWRLDFGASAHWSSASEFRVGHMSGAGRSAPPADPYGAVPVQSLPHRESAQREPVSVSGFDIRQTIGAPGADDHPSERIGRAEISTPVTSTWRPGSDVGYRFAQLDFGRIVAGVVEIQLVARSGTTIDFDFRESPIESGVEAVHGARYISRGLNDVFVSTESHGLRYLVVMADEAVVLNEVTVHERLAPVVSEASFSCSDPSLDALWRAGVRTVRLNTSDGYTDCPTREQRAWVGDGTVHVAVDQVTGGDPRQARNHLWRAASPRPDGLLPMSVAGDIEDAGGETIPAWSLHWIHTLFIVARQEGLTSDLIELLPVAERILRWFDDYIDERGTLRDVPEWNFVDWSSVYTDGRSAILTGFWVRALREFAQLSMLADAPGPARWARSRVQGAQAGFEDFWDASRGVYLDHLDGTQGPHSAAASQLASAAALLAGLAPAERWNRIAETVTDESLLVTRSWFGRSAGFDPAALAAWSVDKQDPDWDARREIVRAEPFGAFFVHEALASIGRVDLVINQLEAWSGFLADGYDTFGEGWGWGTRAHGWSSTPTRDLSVYVLGVQIDCLDEPRALVKPQLGRLGWAEGTVPSRYGAVRVRVTRRSCTIDTPIAVVYTAPDGTVHRRPAGEWVFATTSQRTGRNAS